jgi:hypothetical protein
MKILKIHFSYLRNEAHYQFLLLAKKMLETYSSVASIVSTLLQPFYTLLALEGKLVDAVRASEYTSQLSEADQRLDRAIVGLHAAVNAALHHPDPGFVRAAERLEIRLKAFRGEIEKKAYEEESAAVKILVADLQSSYAPQVSTLSLGVWVTEIAAAQADFEQIFLLRNAERASQPQERLKDVRKQIEAAYRQITERIEAYTVMNGTNVTGTFISRLNDEIAYFNEHNHHRRVPKDINQATVASVADQPWEGKPVTPLPAVTYEGHELVFSVDYELTYHDNSRPGNATLTLHGKGAWKNKKSVSFNIVAKQDETASAPAGQQRHGSA